MFYLTYLFLEAKFKLSVGLFIYIIIQFVEDLPHYPIGGRKAVNDIRAIPHVFTFIRLDVPLMKEL